MFGTQKTSLFNKGNASGHENLSTQIKFGFLTVLLFLSFPLSASFPFVAASVLFDKDKDIKIKIKIKIKRFEPFKVGK